MRRLLFAFWVGCAAISDADSERCADQIERKMGQLAKETCDFAWKMGLDLRPVAFCSKSLAKWRGCGL